MQKLLLTGYSGFVGSYLLKSIQEDYVVSLLGRKEPDNASFDFYQSELNETSDFELALAGTGVVIHCAARTHIMNDEAQDPLAEFRRVNTDGTINLAKQSVAFGVKRFIYISSIKVNGESTEFNKPFKSTDNRLPEDHYGQSKSESEEELLQLAKETEMEVVIIRPTLVYGPGVKANFASLMNLVSKGLPLPFGRITNNRRSLVSVRNLVDLIITCIDHPKAANQVFLVSDDNDVSTASMVKAMSTALGKPNRILPVPLWCFNLIGKVLGKQDKVDRLLGSLQVDISHTKETLGWTPPQTLEEGFKETAEAFVLNKKLNKELNK